MSQQQQQQPAYVGPEPMEDDEAAAAPPQQQQNGAAAVQLAQLLQGHMDALAQLGGGAEGGEEEVDVDFEADEEEDLEGWEEEEEDDLAEVEGLQDMESDEEDEEDEEDAFTDGLFEDDDGDHLTTQQRVELQCGLLHHDAHTTAADAPVRHAGVPSAAHHHQTADALTHLPAPTPPEAAAAVAAAAAGEGGAAAAAGGDGSGSSEAAAAAAAAASIVVDVPPEDVVVSYKGVLSVYRLATGQPSKLLARAKTLFRHYSIAASPCGHYVAATGNSGLVSLFRVQRSSSSSSSSSSSIDGPPAAVARQAAATEPGTQAPGSNPAGDDAAAAESGVLGEGEVDPAGLDWQLVHVATLLCKNGREVMVNSVRFGHFGGRLRMLVAHQDGMLYLFNLPEVQTPKPAAAAAAAAAAYQLGSSSGRTSSHAQAAAADSPFMQPTVLPAAAAAAAVRDAGSAGSDRGGTRRDRGVAGEAAGLMVDSVTDWEPLGSQINARFVEQLMLLLPIAQQAAAKVAWTAGDAAAPEATAAAAAEASAAGQGSSGRARQPAGGEGGEGAAGGGGANSGGGGGVTGVTGLQDAAQPAAGTLRLAVQAINQAERVLWVLLDSLANVHRCPSLKHPSCAAYVSAIRTKQQALQHREQQQQQHGQPQQQQSQQPPEGSQVSGSTRRFSSSWAAKAGAVGQLLQDESCLKGLQILERYRLSYNTSDDWAREQFRLNAVSSWAAAVDALRAASAGQWALLGALGQQRQAQQWAVQQSEGDEEAQGGAAARAAYLLLLLRLLGPIATPRIRQGARVVVLRHGPQAAHRRLSHAEITGAPRLTTCAITGLARDDQASEAARMALAQANADLNLLIGAANVPQELQGAAQIALADAARLASQEHLLPLNIAEASPDGQWLAVGADQLAVVLVPAGAGHAHQICHVLDMCPLLGSRPSAAWHMHQGTLGCQYMSFNSSSTLLAASSDALRLVVVWAVAGPALGQRVASFSLHNRAVLPLRFLPPHHPLTALQQGVAAAAAAARGAATDADAAGEGTAAGVLQLQAGPGALTRAAVGAAGVLGVGSTGQLQDRLLAYCELYGGLHLADLSVFLHAQQQGGVPATLPQHTTSPHYCISTYIELSPRGQQEPPGQSAAAAADADADAAGQAADPGAEQQQQQQEQQEQQQDEPAQDADMSEAEEPVDPAQAEAEAFLNAFMPATAAAAAAGGPPAAAAAAPATSGVGAPAAVVVAAGCVGEDLDTNRAPRINGLALTPAGRVLVACPSELLEWQLVTQWSHTYNKRLPAAFRAAVRTLLTAAAAVTTHSDTSSPAPAAAAAGHLGTLDSTLTGSGGSTGQQLLPQLPGPVLEQVVAAAALPQGVWASAAPPSYSQLVEALQHRPGPPLIEAGGFGLGWPEFQAGQFQFAIGPGQVWQG